MVNKNSILLKYYRDGESKSQISRELKISRKTVRKCIEKHEREIKKGSLKLELEKGISSKPKYDSSGRRKRKLIKELEDEINYCLTKNKEKRNSGLHKQLMKKVDIYEYLQSKGYKIGYTTICNYIRDVESFGKESFIKQLYKPGDICEFDWGEVKLKIDGKLTTFNLAVFTSAYSNYRWAKLFYRQDSLAFGQSHIDFFQHTGKVFKTMVYDNMRVAIKRFVGHSEKEPTEGLLELSNYYKFGYKFCNIGRGNEKGHVERSVEYIRRKAFCISDEFSSSQEANKHLNKICERLNGEEQKLKDNKTGIELYKKEEPYLYKTKIPYKCFHEEYSKVDKYSTVIIYGNRYSVPDFLVGKLLKAKIFAEKIDFYLKEEFVSTHKRSYGAHTWTIDIKHYLTTLKRKPGALNGSVAFDQLNDQVKNIYREYFAEDDTKGFIELLQYCKDNNIKYSKIKDSIDELKNISPINISKDKILVIMDKTKNKVDNSYYHQDKKSDEIEKHSKESLVELSKLLN